MRDQESKQTTQASYILRLPQEVYERIEGRTKPVDVGYETTALQAAFIAGQQSVLAILRRDFVVSKV